MTAQPADYEKVKQLAREGEAAVRRELAARPDLPPEMLYFLAQDEDPEVRAAVAANPATPHKADAFLAEDASEAVRSALGRRIGQSWKAESDDVVQRILGMLGRDQAMRVRHAVAETLKDKIAAPYDLIASLARDTEELVALPVLEHSPVLEDTDLIEIIGAGASDRALSAIARRNDLGSVVTDALVDSGSVPAVTHLLRNGKAQIREETLDRLIDRASDVPPWQEALVERDGIPHAATVKLAGILADHLLAKLVQRHALDPKLAQDLQKVAQQRVREAIAKPARGNDQARLDARIDQLRAQHEAGQLDDASVLAAIVSQDRTFVIAALHVVTELPLLTVIDVLRSGSAKAICALCWRAGLSPEVAAEVQSRIGGVPVGDVLGPTAAGGYAMSAAAMEWQLDLFNAGGV